MVAFGSAPSLAAASWRNVRPSGSAMSVSSAPSTLKSRPSVR